MMKKASVSLTREAVSLDAATSKKWMFILGGIGVLGLGLSAVGFAADRAQFYHSYLVAFIFCLSLALGSLFFVILQHVVGAHWSVVVRRIAENVMASMPVLVVLFLPLLFGLHDLYHWTHHEAVAHDELLQAKEPYLNTTFFGIRLVVYFAFWLVIGLVFYRKSIAVDETGDVRTVQWLRRWSAPAILVYALTQTFAAFDLLMSLDPHWYSTIFGVYYFAGIVMASGAAFILSSMALQKSGMLERAISTEHYHDLGKWTFAFIIFWTYIGFSQFFLIWYANIPEETIWYGHRMSHGWEYVSIFLALGHFIVPMFYMMSRHIKRRRMTLAVGAAWLLFAHYVDMFWLVQPAVHVEHFSIHIADLLTLVGLGGVVIGAYAWLTTRTPTAPIQDPRLEESLKFENF